MKVVALEKWNDTGLDVVDGQRLAIKVTGQWTDWFIPACGPEGYDRWWLWPITWLRRMPSARWFELVGCAGQNLINCVVIGDARAFTVKGDGRLYLFANDAPSAYWNNRGALDVTITPMDDEV